MARTIPEETIRRIKNSANIVDIVGDHVVLKNSGRNYLGLCPFHAEKTPSFTVSPEKQIFYCFGCHTGGNVFSFIMQQEGLSFPEAVRQVAGKYGIEVPDERLSPQQKRVMSEKEKLYRINELAMAFFHRMLLDLHVGQQANTYLVGRGMTRGVIEKHRLGYAPDRWDGLLNHLRQKRVPLDLLAKSGLIVPRKESGGYYDRFRDRVIFPIFNLNRQVIGFGGRVMTDSMPKYLNSPESPIYNKRRSLYGMDKAKQAARAGGIIHVVEGYFDVLALHQFGIDNAVATLGTALTAEHVQLLKGMVGAGGQAVLVYDSDVAGMKAAQRSIAVFEQGYLDARILVLPDGYDPDDFLREYGPTDFLKAAAQALGMVPFLTSRAIDRHGLSIEGRVKVVAAMKAPLAAVQDSVARSLYIKQLAEKLNIDESAVLGQIRKATRESSRESKGGRLPEPDPLADDGRRLEQQIVAMILRSPVMIPEIVGRNLLDLFEDRKLSAIAEMMMNQSATEEEQVADLVSRIDDPHYRDLLTRLAMDEQRWDRQGCERLLNQFESHHRRRFKNDLQRQIEAAERDNDVELLSELLKQKQNQAGAGLTNS